MSVCSLNWTLFPVIGIAAACGHRAERVWQCPWAQATSQVLTEASLVCFSHWNSELRNGALTCGDDLCDVDTESGGGQMHGGSSRSQVGGRESVAQGLWPAGLWWPGAEPAGRCSQQGVVA